MSDRKYLRVLVGFGFCMTARSKLISKHFQLIISIPYVHPIHRMNETTGMLPLLEGELDLCHARRA